MLVAGGFDYYASGLLTGRLIQEIIEGKSPADIGTVFLEDLELYINMDTAEMFGITIPEDMIEKAAYIIDEE